MILEMNPHGRSILCAATMWCLFFIMAVLIRNTDLKHRTTNKRQALRGDRINSESANAPGEEDGHATITSKDNITIGVHSGVSVVAYNVLDYGDDAEIIREYIRSNVKHTHARYLNVLNEEYPRLKYSCNLTDSKIILAVKKCQDSSFIENTSGAFSRPEEHQDSFVRIALVVEPLQRVISSFENARRIRSKLKIETPRMVVDKQFLDDKCETPFSKGFLCDPIVADSFLVNYFCGCKSKCFTDGEWALDRAKFNVVNHFAVVGVVEQVDVYAFMLEKLMPTIFKANTLSSLSRTLKIQTLKNDSRLQNLRLNQFLEKKLALDFEFYGFIRRRFAKQKKALGI